MFGRNTGRRVSLLISAALVTGLISPEFTMAAFSDGDADDGSCFESVSLNEETEQVLGDEEDGITAVEDDAPVEETADAVFEAPIDGAEGAELYDAGLDDYGDEDEYGIVFDNLDEVDPVVHVPQKVIGDSGEAVVGASGVITANSPKYIPIGHASSPEYVNYHTRAKQQSISADAVDNKRKYINETCWAFATMGALEASHNIHYGISNATTENRGLTSEDGALDLSERALVYYTYFNDNRTVPDAMKTLEKDNNYLYIGSTDINTAKMATIAQSFAFGGVPNYAMENLAMGIGPVREDEVPYSTESQPKLNLEKVDGSQKFADEFAMTGGYVIDMAQKDLVKNMILKYGGVSTSIYYASKYMNTVSANGGKTVYFHHPSPAQNHNVLIVGWDDEVKPALFANSVHTSGSEEPGAWLCKNSYGNETNSRGNTGSAWGNEYGYFWVSYDTTDELLSSKGVRRGFIFDMETLEGAAQGVSENRTYQYDGSAFSKEITAGSSYANVYDVKSHGDGTYEYLRSVMVKLSSPGSVYSVQVYADPKAEDPTSGTPLLSAPVYGKVDAAGYYTLNLGRGIELKADKKFSVVVNLYKAGAGDDTPGIYSGVSGKFTMSVAKNALIVPEDETSLTVPAMYYCRNSTKAGHSMLYNMSTGQWEDMFNNEDSKNIHGNLRIKLKTVIREDPEHRVDPSYDVVDHFERKIKETGSKDQPLIIIDPTDVESGTTILYVGQTAIIRAGELTTADWISKKPKIATVDSTGLITAVKKGVTQIRAVVDGQEFTHRIMVRTPCFVTTRRKLTVTNSAKLSINGKYQDVVWFSAKPDVVAIDEATGTVTALRDGASLIKATIGNTTVKCKITVPKILFTEKAVTLAPEYPTYQFRFRDPLIDLKQAQFESADPSVVEIDQATGLAKAVGNGKTYVTAKVGGAVTKCTVTVMGY